MQMNNENNLYKVAVTFAIASIVFAWLLQAVLFVMAWCLSKYILNIFSNGLFNVSITFTIIYISSLIPSLMITYFIHMLAIRYSPRYLFCEFFQPLALLGFWSICFGQAKDIRVGIIFVTIGIFNIAIGHFIMKKHFIGKM